MWRWLIGLPPKKKQKSFEELRILKHAQAMRVIFFYPGEEGTYIDGATVTLFENGVVHIRGKNEETTTHLQHCEILWRCELVDPRKTEPKTNLRVLKFKPRESHKQTPEPPASH